MPLASSRANSRYSAQTTLPATSDKFAAGQKAYAAPFYGNFSLDINASNTSNASLNGTAVVEEPAEGVSLRFSYFVGICLSVLATVAGTYGKQAIRLSELRKQDGRMVASHFLLYSGIFTNTVIGPVLDSVAYAFAPQAVLAPFTGMDIVWNTLVAPCTLGEERTKRRCTAATLVFAGTTGSVLFNVQQQHAWDSAYLHKTLVRWRTLGYFFVYGLWFGWGNFRLLSLERGSTKRGFYYGAIAGSLAGNMFCLKCLAEVVKRNLTTGDWTTWLDWLTWALLVGAIFFAVSNVFYMTKGMKAYETLYMVTIYEGSNIVVNSASAIIVLDEMAGAPWWKYAGYAACIGIIIFALVLLVRGEKVLKAKQDSEELLAMAEDANDSEELSHLAASSSSEAAAGRRKPPTFAMICNGEIVCTY